MYPQHYLSLFPPFPRNSKVFVAMSFDARFDNRWENVITPAIRDLDLEPHRVDMSKFSDSVVTEITKGISEDRLVFADVTTIGELEDAPVRNQNVMYEVGIAHACRLPEEVVLFRSDSDPLSFDIANVRVNHYDPDKEPAVAKEDVSAAIKDALREADLKQHFAVESVAKSIDQLGWYILSKAWHKGYYQSFPIFPLEGPWDTIRTMPQDIATTRLLQLGVLETNFKERAIQITRHYNNPTKEVPANEKISFYRITPFGKVVYWKILESMHVSEEEILKESKSSEPRKA